MCNISTKLMEVTYTMFSTQKQYKTNIFNEIKKYIETTIH